jgi:hypothetical protein
MNQNNNPEPEDEMRAEYDFSGGVRGKFYQEYIKGTNVVLLVREIKTTEAWNQMNSSPATLE